MKRSLFFIALLTTAGHVFVVAQEHTNLEVTTAIIEDSAGGKQGTDLQVLAPGTESPTFSLASLTNERVSLRTWCGELNKPYVNSIKHTVIISFWATYCAPCQKEIPELMAFAAKHTGDPIKIFCVSIDKEGAAKVGPFVAEKKYTLPVLLDPYATTAKRYGALRLPALFVIDGDGIIRYSSVGFDKSVSLVEKLESIIAGISGNKNSDHLGPSLGLKVNESTSVAGKVVVQAAAVLLTPKQKWDAVVKVECGQRVEAVAADLKVTPEKVRGWYEQLKAASLGIWAADSAK